MLDYFVQSLFQCPRVERCLAFQQLRLIEVVRIVALTLEEPVLYWCKPYLAQHQPLFRAAPLG